MRCSNASCGTIWLDPAPVEEDIWIAYRKYFTHEAPPAALTGVRRLYRDLRRGYLATRFGYQSPSVKAWHRESGWLLALVPELRAYFDASVMWLPAQPGGNVLEVGCGRGDLMMFLGELGWNVLGIELDRRAAEIARNRGLNVREGVLEDQALSGGSFDAIVMSHVIEHLFDPQRTIGDCWRLLKPGGRLVLLTPNTGSLGHRLFGRDWMHLDPPRHLHLFNADTLSRLAREAGFARVRSFTHVRDAHMTLGASMQLRRRGHYVLGRLPWPLKLAGAVLTNLEWLGMLLFPRIGEELTVIAEK